jgi:hypothetical protein
MDIFVILVLVIIIFFFVSIKFNREKFVINYDQPMDFTKRTELKKTDKLKRKYKSVDERLNNYTLDYYDYNKDFENIKDYKYNQNIVDGFSNLKY